VPVADDAALVGIGEALAAGAIVAATEAAAAAGAVGARVAGGGVMVAVAPPQAARSRVSTPMLSMANERFMVLLLAGDASPPIPLPVVPAKTRGTDALLPRSIPYRRQREPIPPMKNPSLASIAADSFAHER
jgi:hypothetical protein